MAPPPYADLGKNARDVFGKGYHFGLIKLDCKTKTGSGVEFSTGGTSNQETGKVFGSLETKYKIKDYNLTFSEKWNTDNTLGTEITIQDQLLKGLKLGAECTFAPQTGSKSGKVKTEYRNEHLALNCDLDLAPNGPNILTSAVIGYQGWLAGYQTGFDAEKMKLIKHNFALGFSTGDFILHTNVNINDENNALFGASIYQKVSSKVEAGVHIDWSPAAEGGEGEEAAANSKTVLGIGAKYAFDESATVKAKINTKGELGLSLQQLLRQGMTMTLSMLVNGMNFNNGGHKIGLGLEFEA